MTFAKTIVLLTFAALFGAGVVTGLVGRRLATPPPQKQAPRSYLKTQLDLTADQEAKMKEVWDTFNDHRMQFEQARRACGQQRDKDVQGMLTAEQKAQYAQILARHDAAVAKLREETEAERKKTDEQTRALLNPEQLKKYDAITREREARGPRGGPGGPGSRPTSRGAGGPQGQGPGQGSGQGPQDGVGAQPMPSH